MTGEEFEHMHQVVTTEVKWARANPMTKWHEYEKKHNLPAGTLWRSVESDNKFWHEVHRLQNTPIGE